MNTTVIDAFEQVILRNSETQQVQATNTPTAPTSITSNFLIVDYSEKALAVFGDTKAIKDELKALGGRFNPKLSHEGNKRAGWIFSKNKENELRDLLTIK